MGIKLRRYDKVTHPVHGDGVIELEWADYPGTFEVRFSHGIECINERLLTLAERFTPNCKCGKKIRHQGECKPLVAPYTWNTRKRKPGGEPRKNASTRKRRIRRRIYEPEFRPNIKPLLPYMKNSREWETFKAANPRVFT